MGQAITLSTALNIFSENTEDIKSALLENIHNTIVEVKKEHAFVTEYINKLHEEVWQSCIQYQIQERTQHMQLALKRIIARQQQALTPNSGYITDEHIERAKEFPIQELYEGKLRRAGKNLLGTCPFHSEKTASFYITPQNKFKCFGCGAYGDSIEFYKRLNNLTSKDFIKIIRALQG
ncbi:TPA: hypothetical protein DEP58_01565 [Patescibacteria group bacterium]|nr:hypothetical protein [Patescibacteria group bacterium]